MSLGIPLAGMGVAMASDAINRAGYSGFATTHWTVVFAAGGADAAAKNAALSTLCRAYWGPVFSYIRRRGYGDESEDLTQEFFARLLEHDWLSGLTREGSKFRAFLLVAVKRFLAVECERRNTAKRGGGLSRVPLVDDDQEAASRGETPENAFDRRWALTVIDRAIERLRDEAKASGRTALFDGVARFLAADPEAGAYEKAAADLRTSRASIAMAVFRLRLRLRDHIRSEVAETLADAGLVEDEMRELVRALRG